MDEGIEELQRRREKAKQMGGEEQVRLQHRHGRLTARERIDKLLDPGSFWEVGLLNHSDVPEMAELSPADGRICGIGTIDGRKVAVAAQDRTVLGGSGGRVAYWKKTNLRRLATEKGYPIIDLGDDVGGIRLPDQMGARGFSQGRPIGTGAPEPTWHVTRQTPRVATIMGECFGEPTWDAVQADFVVMVKGAAMGAAGPRVIEKAIGEKVTPQQLCGWEIQANFTGQVDAFAETDEECLATVRRFLSYLPSHNGEEPPYQPTNDNPYRKLTDISKIVPSQLNRGYDMHLLIKAIVDDGKYFPIRAEFAKAMVTCLGRIGGRVIGIVANNPSYHAGAPDVPAIEKATEFLCLCDSFNIPLVFLVDIPGMYPGMDSEKEKLPTKIVVLLQAIGQITVPKIHILVRKAYGIGWRCMCSGQEDIAAAWPIASISFVDPVIGVELVHGRKIAEVAEPEAERERLLQEWAVDSAPWEAAGVTPMEIIDPRDTRIFIAESLDILRGNRGNSISKHQLASWPTGF